MTKKKILFSIFIITFSMFYVSALDRVNIVGTYNSPFPYPFRFQILDNDKINLEWTDTGEEYRSWEKSKIYNYTLTEDSIFFRLELSEDVPNTLWIPISGDLATWNVGNVLLGLFGVDEESGIVMSVIYARMKSNYGTDVFTVDVPNYIFSGPARRYPLTFSSPSSELKEKDLIYELRNLDSVISDQAWVEGNEGNGIGESFKITFNETPQYLAIINGYISTANPSLYWENGRVKELTIEGLTSGVTIKRSVLDTPHLQTIDVRELSNEKIVRISISDVYNGTKYSDTCLHFMSYSENSIRPLSIFSSKK